MLYGVAFVHCTWIVEIWSTLAAITPNEPKSSVDALLMMQEAVIVICTEKVLVVVVAPAAPPKSVSVSRAIQVFCSIFVVPTAEDRDAAKHSRPWLHPRNAMNYKG